MEILTVVAQRAGFEFDLYNIGKPNKGETWTAMLQKALSRYDLVSWSRYLKST